MKVNEIKSVLSKLTIIFNTAGPEQRVAIAYTLGVREADVDRFWEALCDNDEIIAFYEKAESLRTALAIIEKNE